jgi:hypothetical protein
MVLLGARPSPVGLFVLATKESFGEVTIGTSRGKVLCKSPFLACQLSVFFAPVRYRVVKIVRFSSEVVLQTTKARGDLIEVIYQEMTPPLQAEEGGHQPKNN